MKTTEMAIGLVSLRTSLTSGEVALCSGCITKTQKIKSESVA